MIAFGVAISDRRKYEELALPGIRRAAEPDSSILSRAGLSIQAAYNEMMEEAGAKPGLEALVLLHQDLELRDDSLPRLIRRLFADPRVGMAGALGARNVNPHVWPASQNLYGVFMEPSGERRFSTGSHKVDGVDGVLLVLAPWVVRGLRFNEALAGGFHGYDLDMSLRVRAHGGKVICADIPYFHHREPSEDYRAQGRAGVAVARMWNRDLRAPEWLPAFER